MALSYNDLRNRALDGEFQIQIAIALVRAALEVYSEDPATVGHAKRVAFARQVASNPEGAAHQFALLVAIEGDVIAVETKVDDATVQKAIAVIWDLLAGV